MSNRYDLVMALFISVGVVVIAILLGIIFFLSYDNGSEAVDYFAMPDDICQTGGAGGGAAYVSAVRLSGEYSLTYVSRNGYLVTHRYILRDGAWELSSTVRVANAEAC